MRYQLLLDEQLFRYTVDAIIECAGKILLFHRKCFPFHHTIVAGHWDLNDLPPESAIADAIEEDAQIQLSSEEPVCVETLRDLCRRGADFHEWRLYQAQVNIVTMSDEAHILGWYGPDEMQGPDLTIPTEYFLEKLEIV